MMDKKGSNKWKKFVSRGYKKVIGNFKKGDHIKILDSKRKEFARGLSSFSSNEINKILDVIQMKYKNSWLYFKI